MTSVPKPDSKLRGILPPIPSKKPDVPSKTPVNSSEAANWTPTSPTQTRAAEAATPAANPVSATANASVLSAISDGTATLKIPLRPGKYSLNGIDFSIEPPGATAQVKVQVKNGELVSNSGDNHGTELTIEPPLSLPLWLTGKGARLTGSGAQQEVQLKLGGFFDVNLNARKLSDVLAGTPSATKGGKNQSAEAQSVAERLLDLSAVQVNAEVEMRPGPLEVGGAKVLVRPGTLFSIEGDGQKTSVKGDVRVDRLSFEQPDFRFASSGQADAKLDMELEKTATGHTLQSRITVPNLSVDYLATSRVSTAAPGAVDKVTLGPTEIRNAQFQLTSQVQLRGLQQPSFTPPTIDAWFLAKGAIKDSEVFLSHPVQPGKVKVSGNLDGAVYFNPAQGFNIEGELSSANIDVKNLTREVDGKKFTIDRVDAQGNFKVALGADTLSLEGDAKYIDVLMSDFQKQGTQLRLDMGKTHIAGAGHLSVGPEGLKTKGDFPHSTAIIEHASYKQESGKTTTIGHSEFSGTVTKLDFTGENPVLEFVNLETSLKVDNLAVEAKGATAQVRGRLTGSATEVVLNDKGFSLSGGQLETHTHLTSHIPHNLIPGVQLHSSKTEISGKSTVKLNNASVREGELSFDSAQATLEAKAGTHTPVTSQPQAIELLSADSVKGATAAQLAGVPPAAAPAGSPVDALRLLRDGTVEVEIPLKGAVSGLGVDWLKLDGAKMRVALVVKDGRIVASETKALIDEGVRLFGGATVGGASITGAHLSDEHRLHLDVRALGVTGSIPTMKLPATMDKLAELVGSQTSRGNGSLGQYFDISQARIDISNATFKEGKLPLPGGFVDIADGSKLSFHGTPLKGELTGSIGIGPGGVQLDQERLALQGAEGKATIQIAFRREGDKAIVDTTLGNLSGKIDYLLTKNAKGDYLSLGEGQISGASMNFTAQMPVGESGLPAVSGVKVSDVAINVQKFSGDLKGARATTNKGAVVELGPSHVDGHLELTPADELLLMAKVSQLDAHVRDVTVKDGSRQLQVTEGRFSGRKGEIRIAPNDVLVLDAENLSWDLHGRIAELTRAKGPLRNGDVRISGNGKLAFQSATGALQVQGTLRAEGDLRASGSGELPTPTRR